VVAAAGRWPVVAFIIKPSGELAKAAAGSLLGDAELDRAKDTYVLAKRGSAHCKRLWNDFQAESPAMARIVVAWAEAERGERAEANRQVDRALVASEALLTKAKGSGVCLGCGERLRTKDKRCPQCGAKNKFHRPGAGQMKGKKARRAVRKAQYRGMLRKAAGGVPVRSDGEAVRAMIAQDLDSPDPGRREAARVALARLR
jgi:hypothetical protein